MFIGLPRTRVSHRDTERYPFSVPSSRRLRRSPLRAILYARVSRDQKQGRSVSQQLVLGRRLAADEGWQIVAEYADNDRSASRHASRDREDWPKVVDAISAGEADVLWVWEISRGTRDLEVWAKLARVCREQQMWIALDDEVWDTTRPNHMKHLNELMVDAVYESDKTQQRIHRDIEANAEQGRPHGPVGYGYRREYDPSTGALLRQVLDPETAKIRRRIVTEFLAGKSRETIAKELNADRIPNPSGYVVGEPVVHQQTGEPLYDPNGRPRLSVGWTARVLTQQLRTPTIMGKRSYRGRVIDDGGWEALVSPAEYWAVQEQLARYKDSGRDPTARHLLSGIALCDPCGGHIGTIKRTDRSGREYGRAYRCDPARRGPSDRGHVVREVPRLDAQVEALVVAEFSAPDVLARFRSQGPSPEDIERAQDELARLRADLDVLYGEVERGVTSRDMARADEARLRRDIARAEEEARPRLVEPLAEDLAEEDPAVVLETWRSWSLEQRRAALRAFTTEIRVLKLQGRRKVAPGESVRIVWVGERGAAP